MENTKKTFSARRMTSSAVCLALCMLLPLITGQNPMLGSALGLMHIPVLLCGFVSGPMHGAIIGLIAPLMRSAIFGMPPMIPMAVSMSYELMTYGLISGALYAALPKKTINIYISLITAMILGRIVFGAAMAIVTGATASVSIFLTATQTFTAAAFTDAIPALIVHIALIPIIVIALQKAKVIS